MIQYNTTDILNKAKQLADLVNSDFISYNESLTLLNEAYDKLYQISINAGDNLYVKSMDISHNVIENGERVTTYCLPDDFYQLYSIKSKSVGLVSYPIPRHTKDMTDITRSYEIKNNTLKVYGPFNDYLTVEYFPTPDTLYVKREDFKLDYDLFDGTPIAFNKDILIYNFENTITAFNSDLQQSIKSWSLENTEEVGYTTSIKVKRAVAGRNGLIVFYTETLTPISSDIPAKPEPNTEKVFVADYDNEGVITVDAGRHYISREDECVYLKENPVTEEPAETIISEVVLPEATITVMADLEGNESIDGNTLPGKGNFIDFVYENEIFITNKDGILSLYNFDEVMQIENSKSLKVISMGDYNLNNGYGYLVKEAGHGYYIKSIFEDTMLNYPNNLYFTLLSYILAMSYKIKQNADISTLSISYRDALDQFYDMFKRDANEHLRINNIYR